MGAFLIMSKLRDEILQRQDKAQEYLSTKRDLWDDLEKLFHNQLNDFVSESTKSQVFDPKLATLTIERGYRVMAQLPTGKVRGISKNDPGTSALMNLVLEKYVLPNANAQFDFLTKLRMTDIYSNVYGNFFGMVDHDIKPNGYIGPDLWLIPIRDVFPQVGAVSVEDSDYIIVRTWKPLSYFESLRGKKGYKNIDKIINKLKDKGGKKQSRDHSRDVSQRDLDQYPDQMAAKGMGYHECLTQFEGDRWVDLCVDADLIFRDQDNPHDNGELPVVCKHSIPLLDDFMGMGDFERGRSMQMVTNSVWNLYLDAVKMSIFPPAIINKDNVAAMSTFKWGAAEKWLGRGQVDNVARVLNLNPQGIATFNNTYQVANASLLNLFGSTDTSVTSQTEPGYGKTPEALRKQDKRENVRDNADRFYMEQFMKKVIKKMVNLVGKKQSKAITLRLFEDDIKELKRTHPDLEEFYDEKTGKLTVDKGKTGSLLYDYEIVSGSTYAVDEKTQQENLLMLMKMVTENPTVLEMLGQDYEIKFGELFKRIISNSGIQDWDKILVERTEEEKTDFILQQDAQKLMQAIEGGLGGQLNQIPPMNNEPSPQAQI